MQPGQQGGSARAVGEQTHTETGRTAGGGVFATSSARSTGTGPPHHEATELRSAPTDFEGMSTYDLRAWLQARSADLRGAVERSELVDTARRVEQQGGAGGAGGSATVEDAIPPRR